MGRKLTKKEEKLKGIIDRSAKKVAKKKEDKKKKGDPNPNGHIDPNHALNGTLAKGDNYRWRGYDYIGKNDGRGVYRNFDHQYLTQEDREYYKSYAEFPKDAEFSNTDKNFHPDHSDKPYHWQAHHLLPGSAFYFETKHKKPAFTYTQLRLILMSDYDINHGHNIMMLPYNDKDVPVHSLLCHPSDHTNYTTKVMEEMQKISKELQETIDSRKQHGNLPEMAFERLKKLEDRFWRLLVKLGRLAVEAHAAGKRYVSDVSYHVKYASNSGKTQYKYGRLW